ncbi:hypothetical protein [Methylobacterium sp. WL8]|uniref:hypothetical protein n=1 Tax=Methylobacterium sp. WL8 TaxID=2603899 RepID=UPI0011C85E8C|nr:hypothetical protein [Methylobacterium sp. WL8]TXN79300.1 hypothetical protein FV234_21070 [Methylobacterium sp. WL8]
MRKASMPSTARPGDGTVSFTSPTSLSSLSGEPADLPALPDAMVALGPGGSIVRVIGKAIVASRYAYPIEPGRIVEARMAVRRRANASDPSNDTIRFGVVWLDQAKNVMPGAVTVLTDLDTLTTASGRQSRVAYLSGSPASNSAYVAPAGAAYFRLFVFSYGLDGVTDIEVLQARDATGNIILPGVTSDFANRLAGQETLLAGPRLDVLEQAIGTPTTLTLLTVSTLSSKNVPANIQAVRTLGYFVPGDKGGATYQRVASVPAHGLYVTSADNAIWELAEVYPSVLQAGARTDGADAYAAFINARAYGRAKKVAFRVPGFSYALSADVALTTLDHFELDAGATFTGHTLTGGDLTAREVNSTPVPGNRAFVGTQDGTAPAFGPVDVGRLFPGKFVGMQRAIAAQFGTDFTGYHDHALATLGVIAVNTGSDASVMPIFTLSLAQVGNVCVTGGNSIVASQQNLPGIKAVCKEDDFQVGSGSTITGDSGGYLLNTFFPNSGPAVQTYGIFGGYWSAGAVHYVTSDTFIGLAPGAGSTMASLFNTGSCTYVSGAAGIFAAGAKARFQGTGGHRSDIYTDGAGFLHILSPGQPTVFRDNTDTSSLFTIGTDGALAVGANAVLGGTQMHVAGTGTTEGVSIGKFTDAQGYGAIEISVARGLVAGGASPNAAAAALKVWRNSTTLRSISTAGTINASGADYAEYERKRDDCGEIIKGQIVGFDADGRLTDRFDLAKRFGIKSTDPNMVGGDTWWLHLGTPPTEPPSYMPAPYQGTPHPGDIPPAAGPQPRMEILPDDATADDRGMAELKYRNAVAKWEGMTALLERYQADVAAHASEVAAYETAEAERRDAYQREIEAEHQAADMAFTAAYEEARATVDRIAYCGKVPVNVTGAEPGAWIVAARGPDGGIIGVVVSDDDVTERQTRRGRGWQVGRILDDGRAEVIV